MAFIPPLETAGLIAQYLNKQNFVFPFLKPKFRRILVKMTGKVDLEGFMPEAYRYHRPTHSLFKTQC
ncbi:hypothetical protein EA58_08845 [Photobacterium galatheae]|uniref:Uncharacterized protein n=1 Tax=Photobacterium galatheae TaxID=1654360 RepID=A0A066RWR8_9GAMM|nr:hypothetical protein EA58_08845 [Photobacterium galatheae]